MANANKCSIGKFTVKGKLLGVVQTVYILYNLNGHLHPAIVSTIHAVTCSDTHAVGCSQIATQHNTVEMYILEGYQQSSAITPFDPRLQWLYMPLLPGFHWRTQRSQGTPKQKVYQHLPAPSSPNSNISKPPNLLISACLSYVVIPLAGDSFKPAQSQRSASQGVFKQRLGAGNGRARHIKLAGTERSHKSDLAEKLGMLQGISYSWLPCWILWILWGRWMDR